MSQIVDERFDFPRIPVNLAVLPNGDMEAFALRSLLEALGCAVLTHWIGTPDDFLKVLAQGAEAPRYLVIAGHGNETGSFYMGEYADIVDTSMVKDQHLPPEAIAPIVNLPGCLIISTACSSGQREVARAFFQNEALGGYIACRISQNGTAMVVFLMNFFFGLFDKKLSEREAWRQAVKATDHPDIYQVSYFGPDGVEEQYG